VNETPNDEETVERLARKYREAGYVVLVDPLPWGDVDLQPDLLVRNENETVVVEIVTASEMHESDGKLARFAQAVAALPGWRLEVHSTGGNVRTPVGAALRNLDEVLEQVRRLVEQEMWIPGILAGWSVIEGTLRELVSTETVTAKAPNPRALVKSAFSLGLVSRGTMDSLLELARIRNAAAHALSPGDDVDLAEAASAILEEAGSLRRLVKENSSPAAVEELVEWFLEHYEDPAHGVPHDSSEGGFQYIKGGPYDPLDELQDQFPDVDEGVLDDAVRRITHEGGWEWVKRGQY